MSEPLRLHSRLSQISTVWADLNAAHGTDHDGAARARLMLSERYGPAVSRYLSVAVRDPHVVDDLTQEFCLRMVRGDFHKANPQKGRFRHYVKTVLFNLVREHFRKQRRSGRELENQIESESDAFDVEEMDREFTQSWRTQLLKRAWQGLQDANPAAYHALNLRAKHPEMRSPQLAEQVAQQVGRPVTAEAVRKSISRARQIFADLLLCELAYSIDSFSRDEIEQELIDLGLHAHCRDALERWEE